MNNPYIRPEAVAILGGAHPVQESVAVLPMTSTPKSSRWDKVKSWARKAGGYIQRAFQFVKEYIVPIAATAMGIFNAWNKYRAYSNAERGTI